MYYGMRDGQTVCLFLGLPSLDACWQRQLAQYSHRTSYFVWPIEMSPHVIDLDLDTLDSQALTRASN